MYMKKKDGFLKTLLNSFLSTTFSPFFLYLKHREGGEITEM